MVKILVGFRNLLTLVHEIVCHYRTVGKNRCLAIGPKRSIILRIHRTVLPMPTHPSTNLHVYIAVALQYTANNFSRIVYTLFVQR